MADAKIGQTAADVQPGGESRPPVAHGAESPDNDRQLRRLAAFLEDAVGFQLALVTYETQELRDRQIERLAEKLQESQVALTRLDLTETPHEKELLQRLRGHLAGFKTPDGKRPAVMVVGLEATLDYRRLGPDAGEGMAILENANAQRDAFARECPVAVAIWLNRTATSALAARAPDLWRWRSGTFRFTARVGWRKQVEERLLELPGVKSDSLPRRAKLERIVSLSDLLSEFSATPEAGTRRGRQRRRALLSELALAHLALGEAQRAIPIFEEGLRLATEIGDRQGQAVDLGNMGVAHYRSGEVKKAIGYYEQALAIDREIGDRRSEGADLGNLASAYADSGEAEKAIACYEQALAIDREFGDRQREGADLGNLGLVYYELRDLEKAIAYLEQRLAIAREMGDRLGEGIALGNLGLAYADLGQLEKSFDYQERSLAIHQEIGDRRGEGQALEALGMAYTRFGQPQNAIRALERALQIGRGVKDARLVRVASRALEDLRRTPQS